MANCISCGGTLKETPQGDCVCEYCGRVYKKQSVDEYEQRLISILGRDRAKKAASCRHDLWTATQAQRLDNSRVLFCCNSLKELIPDDFMAAFCEACARGGVELNSYLRSADEKKALEYADVTFDYLLRVIRPENMSSAGLLVERMLKVDPNAASKYASELETVCEKLKTGIYETAIPRDVFLAYSGEDVKEVARICDYLESQGISCFFALRNLRHGLGAVADFYKAIETAADNCKVVVFISSVHSRSLSCEAITKELPYIKQKDLAAAPPAYRYSYDKLPQEYKMPRVEYLLDSYRGDVGESITKEFFAGLEWCTSLEALSARIAQLLTHTVTYTNTYANTAPKAEPLSFEQRKEKFEIRNGELISYNGDDISVIIPSNVRRIADRAFYNNNQITSVVIPSTVSFIGSEAFKGCVRLKTVTISHGVISIDGGAFADCISLNEISIPSTVIDMGRGVFLGCTSLSKMYLGHAARPQSWHNLWLQCSAKIYWNMEN